MEARQAYSQSAETLLAAHGVAASSGLSAARVEAVRAAVGTNELTEAPPPPRWKRLARQFQSLLIAILMVAALLSVALGEWLDSVVILAIVILNGILGFIQEERAERALGALRKLSAPLAKVRRDGVLQSIPARELVPGDVIVLEAGDHVPADARLVSAFALTVQEAALTGESTPVEKEARAVLAEATPLGDRRNMAYLGTIVAHGKADALVVATGMSTELGRIAGLLERSEPEPTPLQRRLTELGRVLSVVCLLLVGVIFGMQLLRGGDVIELFLVSVSLAVAAVPEGLPAVVTLTLALGLQRLAKRHALVRSLPSVETLGSVTVICTDKTGTLTRNEMTVRQVEAGEKSFTVTGVGYVPQGEFLLEGRAVPAESEPELLRVLTIGARCNNARILPRGEGEASWQVIGDPTEGALLVAAQKAGVDPSPASEQVVYEIPFDAERKMMSVVVRTAEGRLVMYTKGAPEALLAVSTARIDERERVLARSTALASMALRVLGMGFREIPREDPTLYEETGLVFAGLVGMIDPPREEAKAAVGICKAAGIRAVMITGDHPSTAVAIGREIGLAGDGSHALSGPELDALEDDALRQAVDKTAVYARVSPEHKLRVVRAFKARNQIVAMTGDGVNDAPAMKAADIGIAMGITGTDVTREASDMVLTDDNFASIVSAVEEGRGIFANIQKFVLFLLTCNAGEVIFMLVAALFGWPTPLTAIQLLWINLVTDGLPALALAMERPEPGIMREPPRPPHEPVITRANGARILIYGSLVAAVAAFGFHGAFAHDAARISHAQTMAFSIMAFSQVAFSLGYRSQKFTMPQLGFFTNPALLAAIAISSALQLAALTVPFAQSIFRVGERLAEDWPRVILLSLVPVTVVEVGKLLRHAMARKAGTR